MSDDTRIRGASASAKARLRSGLQDLAARYAEEGRRYQNLDGNVFILYALESFLHALSQGERGRHFVLKGGNLFRVWEGMGTPRPTGDLDMQCVDDARDFRDVRDLKAEVEAIVCTAEFREATGLVFDLDAFALTPIRKGGLVAYRLEGKVQLGPNSPVGPRPAEIPFCLEVTYGPPPRGAVELQRWNSVVPRGPSFELLASRPEWMASEKFHSVVTRGTANTRLKDYRDLAQLLRLASFDDQLLHTCIRQVFEELGHSSLVPERVSDVTTLSHAFATPENETLWQRRRFMEWEGRDFDPARDATLSETIAATATELEARGVLAPSAAGNLVSALADLARATGEIERDGATPLQTARMATALKAIAAAQPDASPQDVAWRWTGWARELGMHGQEPLAALERALAVADGLRLTAAIDRGWDKGRGGGTEAVANMRDFLRSATMARTEETAPPRRADERVPARAPRAAAEPRRPAERPVRRKKAQDAPDPDGLLREGLTMLARSRPGSHTWFGGLAKVLSSEGGTPPGGIEFDLDIPDEPRAPFVWRQISKRGGYPHDLSAAIELARVKLGLAGEGPAPGR